MIGPFISDTLPTNYLEQLKTQFSVRNESLFALKQYIESLTIIDQSRLSSISYLLTTFTPKKIIQPNMILSDMSEANLMQPTLVANENSYAEIEKSYRVEKKILNAVERGDHERRLNFWNSIKLIQLIEYLEIHCEPIKIQDFHSILLYVLPLKEWGLTPFIFIYFLIRLLFKLKI